MEQKNFSLLITHLMKKGKKQIASKNLSKCLNLLRMKTCQSPFFEIQLGLNQTSPLMKLRSSTKKGVTKFQPFPLTANANLRGSISSLFKDASQLRGSSFYKRFSTHLILFLTHHPSSSIKIRLSTFYRSSASS